MSKILYHNIVLRKYCYRWYYRRVCQSVACVAPYQASYPVVTSVSPVSFPPSQKTMPAAYTAMTALWSLSVVFLNIQAWRCHNSSSIFYIVKNMMANIAIIIAHFGPSLPNCALLHSPRDTSHLNMPNVFHQNPEKLTKTVNKCPMWKKKSESVP